jgi:hypothetical protein
MMDDMRHPFAEPAPLYRAPLLGLWLIIFGAAWAAIALAVHCCGAA